MDLAGPSRYVPEHDAIHDRRGRRGRLPIGIDDGPVTPPPAPKVIDRLTLHVNFDFDKATIRDADTAELQKAVDFVKKYPGYKISIEGHTDNIGSERYNQRLSERRAAAVKEYLLKHGVADGARIKTAGYGKSKPIADNSTEKGRFENRRVEILILSLNEEERGSAPLTGPGQARGQHPRPWGRV